MMLGPLRHKFTTLERADEQGIGHYFIPRNTRVVDTDESKDDINRSYGLISSRTTLGSDLMSHVGRTTNFDKRMKAHQRPGSRTAGLEPTVRIDNLNHVQARGLEQLGMLYYNSHISKGGMNKYWGIRSNNPRGVTYSLAGLDIGNYLYNQISNEVLYWTGQ